MQLSIVIAFGVHHQLIYLEVEGERDNNLMLESASAHGMDAHPEKSGYNLQ